MARITPFPGVRYDPSRFAGNDLSTAISPPYDVLSEGDRDELLSRHERNIVAIDLPHMPPGFAGPPEAYQRSNDLLTAWLADGTMIRDDTPSLYVYHQRFTHAGRPITRRMFFARLGIEEFGRGTVFPHEQTFGGPKEDRLMLTRATRCNMSPIFALYPDRENEVAAILDVADREPTCRGHLGHVENLLWVVDDPTTISRAIEAMADRAIFIADGHHRYGTAMMYRDELASKQAGLADTHPANFVLTGLCALDDEGLLILPTHRMIHGITADAAVASLESARAIRLEPTEPDNTTDVDPGEFRLYDGGQHRAWRLAVDGPAVLAELAGEKSEAWRRLDVAALHRYLIDEVLAPAADDGSDIKISYVKDLAKGRKQVRDESAIQIEMAATSLSDMKEVCQAGELMPPKSTFFYPKLATGLLINPLFE